MERECKIDEQEKRIKCDTELGMAKISLEKEIKNLEIKGKALELTHMTLRIGIVIAAVLFLGFIYLGYTNIWIEGEIRVSAIKKNVYGFQGYIIIVGELWVTDMLQ